VDNLEWIGVLVGTPVVVGSDSSRFNAHSLSPWKGISVCVCVCVDCSCLCVSALARMCASAQVCVRACVCVAVLV